MNATPVVSVTFDVDVAADAVLLLVRAHDGQPPILATMTARETHRLCRRMRKAANDAGAAAARKRAATTHRVRRPEL